MPIFNPAGANLFVVDITPATNDGAALGTTSLMWADLFLASGGVINWNNGDVTLTHSANALAGAGGSLSWATNFTVTAGGLLETLSTSVLANNFVVTSAGNTQLASGALFGWTSTAGPGITTSSPGTLDSHMLRVGAGVIGVRAAAGVGGALNLIEQSAPSAPAANSVLIYAVDNAGKTQLLALFPTGAAQQLAIEP